MNLYMDIDYFIKGLSIYGFSVLISLFTIIYFLAKGKKSPLLFSSIFFQGLVLLWALCDLSILLPHIFFGLGMAKVNYLLLYIVDVKIRLLPICFIGVCWLVFCLFYTENKIVGNKLIMGSLLIPPVIFYSIILSNDYRILFSASFKQPLVVAFWIISSVSIYLYYIIGLVILIKYAINQTRQILIQTILLLIPSIFILGLLTKTLDVSIFQFTFTLDMAPAGFSLATIMIIIATFKYRFLNIVPIAFETLTENMNQSIVVVDTFNRILEYNKSMQKNLDMGKPIKEYDKIDVLTEHLTNHSGSSNDNSTVINAINTGTVSEFKGELCCAFPEKRYFSVSIQPVLRNRKETLGRIITFNDITEYKKLVEESNNKSEELAAMNDELTVLNDKLKKYASDVEELTITRERNRFARDVHDTLGHTMTALITLMKVVQITGRTNAEEAEEKLSEAINMAKEGLKEIRRTISGLIPEKLENLDLKHALKDMFAGYEKAGVNIKFSADETDSSNYRQFSETIFRVCQEALTNALRHGKAENITVILRASEDAVTLFIVDDGHGCSDIKKGFGLTGMEQRVSSLGGHMECGSDGEKGFSVYVEIPVSSEKEQLAIRM